MLCADLSRTPRRSVARTRSEGAYLAGVLGRTLGRTSGIEVICSDFVARREVKYLLPRARKAALACNIPELSRQFSVMLAI